MKKIILLWTIFLPALIFAQTEKITFTKKFTYSTLRGYPLPTEADLYFSKKGMFVNLSGNKILLKSGIVANVDVDLDNNAIFLPLTIIPQTDSMFTYKFEKLNEKGQYSGYTCNYYKLLKKNRNNSENDNLKMCVVEDNSLDVLSYINNNKKDIVRGFPVSIVEDIDTLLVLKSITPCSNYISIDFNGELAKLKKLQGKFKTPAIVDSTIVADTIVAVSTYQSEYKKAGGDQNESNLAIDNLKKTDSYWQGIPQFCTDLEKKIPEFKDKKLKDHVKNYAGQLCDMYLSFVDEYSVDKKGTMDQIRYEENYFRNTKFNKDDQKLLNEFLNNLD